MTADFDVASAVEAAGDGRWRARIPAGWRQGAGAFGGLGAAVLLRAMSEAAGRAARTVSVQFCAPVLEGEHAAEVTVERQGTGMTFASSRLRHGDRVVLHAMGTFGADRSDRLDLGAAPLLDLPPPSECAAADTPSPPFPQFLQHFEVRVATGAFPAGGAGQERIGAWVRPRAPVPLSPWLAVALLDAMPPVALTRAPRPVGMASVSLHANLLGPLPDAGADPAAFTYVEVRSAATRGGYSEQSARLYGAGRLVATVSQLFAVL